MDTKQKNSLAFDLDIHFGARKFRLKLKSVGSWAITALIIIAQLAPQLFKMYRGGG